MKVKAPDSSFETELDMVNLGLVPSSFERVITEIAGNKVIVERKVHFLIDFFLFLAKSRIPPTRKQTTEVIEINEFFLFHFFLPLGIVDGEALNNRHAFFFADLLKEYFWIKLLQLCSRHDRIIVVPHNIDERYFIISVLDLILIAVLLEYSWEVLFYWVVSQEILETEFV